MLSAPAKITATCPTTLPLLLLDEEAPKQGAHTVKHFYPLEVGKQRHVRIFLSLICWLVKYPSFAFLILPVTASILLISQFCQNWPDIWQTLTCFDPDPLTIIFYNRQSKLLHAHHNPCRKSDSNKWERIKPTIRNKPCPTLLLFQPASDLLISFSLSAVYTVPLTLETIHLAQVALLLRFIISIRTVLLPLLNAPLNDTAHGQRTKLQYQVSTRNWKGKRWEIDKHTSGCLCLF